MYRSFFCLGNLCTLEKLYSIFDFELFVGLVQISSQLETVIDMGFRIFYIMEIRIILYQRSNL